MPGCDGACPARWLVAEGAHTRGLAAVPARQCPGRTPAPAATPMKTIIQSEASECGLASLAMVADAHGLHIGLAETRRLFPLSLKGAKLNQLIHVAQQLHLRQPDARHRQPRGAAGAHGAGLQQCQPAGVRDRTHRRDLDRCSAPTGCWSWKEAGSRSS